MYVYSGFTFVSSNTWYVPARGAWLLSQSSVGGACVEYEYQRRLLAWKSSGLLWFLVVFEVQQILKVALEDEDTLGNHADKR